MLSAVEKEKAGTPGVVEHGLFAPGLVTDVLVATGTQVDSLRRS